MDSLTYHYNTQGGPLLNNRLRHIKDSIAATNYVVDIDSQAEDNYSYYAICNLVKERQESSDDIDW